jgi:hypothetical protein
MLKANVPFSAAIAFLLASLLLNPVVIIALWLLFGWMVGLIYIVSIITLTLLLAFTWELLGFEKFVKKVRIKSEAEEKPWQGIKQELSPAWRAALSTLRPLIIPLLVGVLIGALIYGIVPEDFIRHTVSNYDAFAVPLAAIIGIPLYIRIETILPIGLALYESGLGIGVVFALIIGGAGASIPEVSMLTAIFKPRLVALFVITVLTIAIASGYILPWLI